jgi:hypothetical protein
MRWGAKSGDGGFRWHHRGLIRGGKVRPHNRKWNMEAGSKKNCPPGHPAATHVSHSPTKPHAPHSMCMCENKAQLERVPKTEGGGPVTGSQGLGGANHPNERRPKKKREQHHTSLQHAGKQTRASGAEANPSQHQTKMYIRMQCMGVSSGSGACSTQGTGWEQGRGSHTNLTRGEGSRGVPC